MKTVKHSRTHEIRRVSDKEAKILVKQGFDYCPKFEWKEEVRDGKAIKTMGV